MSIELVVSYKGEEQVLHVADDDIIFFPDGLVGFAEWRRFVFIEDPDEAPVGVLQCVDDPSVSFVVTAPRFVAPDYDIEIPLECVEDIGIETPEDSRVLCVLTVKDGPVRVTANLLAPIVIHTATRMAQQVILQDSQYSVQHPVLIVEGAEVEACG